MPKAMQSIYAGCFGYSKDTSFAHQHGKKMNTTTKAKLLSAVKTYCMLPTSKRDVPSKSLQNLAHRSINVFLQHYDRVEYPVGVELVVMIKDFLAQSSHSRNTRYKYAKTLAAILKEQYLIDSSAASDLVRRFSVKTSKDWSDKAMSDAEMQLLFQRMDAYCTKYNDLKHYISICLMLFSGARISAALMAKDYTLDAEALSFYIPRQKSRTVEDIQKSIPLDITMPNGMKFRDVAVKYIRMRERQSVRNQYLIPGNGNTHGSTSAVRAYINKLNLPFKFTPHALRHTAGTLMAERVGVLEATRLLDHSSINITQKYIKRNTSNSKESIRQAWSRPVPTQDPELTPAMSTDLQAVVDKFHKDAQRLSEIVSRLNA